MASHKSLVAWIAIVLLVIAADVVAQNGKSSTTQGGTPNGKPFQHVQSQFAQMNQRIQALQTQIDGVEAGLQAQIDGINASLTALYGSAGSVAEALAAINARIDGNEASITALESAIGSLQAAAVAVETDLIALQNQVAAYESDTIENTAAILALQTQAGQLAALIAGHTAQIATLQGQIESASSFLTNMANATCAVGQAVSDIGPSGSITCMTPASGGSFFVEAAQFSWAFPAGVHAFVVNCPLTYKATGGGYNGAFGITVTGSHPNTTSYVVRVQSALASASIQVFAKCIGTL